jgi:MFS family permease
LKEIELKAIHGLAEYARKVRLLQGNARLYLASIILFGLGFGVYRLLFNFYILSLGYSEGFLGTLISVNSMAALGSALPAAFVSDLLGRKRSFLLSTVLSALAVIGVITWRHTLSFILMNALFGMSNSLQGVTGGPFMMENSGEEERNYLFSFSFGLQTLAGFMGNSFGGKLPAWMAGLAGVAPTSTTAYAWSLVFTAGTLLLALLPFALLKPVRITRRIDSVLAPFKFASQNLALLSKLVGPMLIISFGAGLLIPFLNVFYRSVHGRSDGVIGFLFALGSLSMGVGLLLAPPLADRLGKIQLVVISQSISIPFLFVLGFSPWFEVSAAAYLIRGALMNMSNPIYQAFVLEQVDEDARAMIASLVSMSWNFGWSFAPQISGWVQEGYGFAPLFFGTAGTYAIATYLSYRFFVRRSPERETT